MKNPFGFGLAALAATASLAVAGGDDEKKNGTKATSPLERMTNAPQGGGVTTKAAPGAGIQITSGEDFSLTLKNRVQVRWRFHAFEAAPDVNTFDVLRARTAMEGNLYNADMTYKLQMEWSTATNNLRDAWFRWRFWKSDTNEIALRIGAQKTFFGKEATGTSNNLEFTDRSIVTRTFSNNRQVGAMVQGAHMPEKKLNWHAGLFNADPAAGAVAIAENGNLAANVDNEIDIIVGVRFDPMGDMGDEGYEQGDLRPADKQDLAASIGAGLVVGNHKTIATGADVETTAININGALKVRGFHVLGEVFLRSDDPDVAGANETDSTGFQVGGSYTLQPTGGGHSQWSFGGRFSMISLDDVGQVALVGGHSLGAAEGDQTELEAMVSNYYRKHKLKTQLGYRHQTVDPDGGTKQDNDFFEVVFTWVF
jgi:hypothetical protein